MKVERINIQKIKQIENSRGSVDKDLASLMSSIQQHGLQQPIGVNYDKDGKYNIMYGNRRLHACIKLGWNSIPAVLYTEKDKKDFIIHNVIENVQRQNLSPVELGRSCEQLEKEGLTVQEIIARLGLPASTVEACLRIYKEFPKELREKVTFKTPGSKKNGQINVTNVVRTMGIRKKYGLTKQNIVKITSHIKSDNLSNRDIQVVGSLMKSGVSLSKSLIQRKQYCSYRLDVLGIREEVEELAKQANCTPLQYLTKVIYGVAEPISKPSFLKIPQRKAE